MRDSVPLQEDRGHFLPYLEGKSCIQYNSSTQKRKRACQAQSNGGNQLRNFVLRFEKTNNVHVSWGKYSIIAPDNTPARTRHGFSSSNWRVGPLPASFISIPNGPLHSPQGAGEAPLFSLSSFGSRPHLLVSETRVISTVSASYLSRGHASATPEEANGVNMETNRTARGVFGSTEGLKTETVPHWWDA